VSAGVASAYFWKDEGDRGVADDRGSARGLGRSRGAAAGLCHGGGGGADLRANLPPEIARPVWLLGPGRAGAGAHRPARGDPGGVRDAGRPRSGLALKHGISVPNAPGTIDSDYRGPLGVILVNLGDAPFVVEHGARIAQAVIAPVVQASSRFVERSTTRNGVRAASGRPGSADAAGRGAGCHDLGDRGGDGRAEGGTAQHAGAALRGGAGAAGGAARGASPARGDRRVAGAVVDPRGGRGVGACLPVGAEPAARAGERIEASARRTRARPRRARSAAELERYARHITLARYRRWRAAGAEAGQGAGRGRRAASGRRRFSISRRRGGADRDHRRGHGGPVEPAATGDPHRCAAGHAQGLLRPGRDRGAEPPCGGRAPTTVR
jgi:dUTP pyrophosphatase